MVFAKTTDGGKIFAEDDRPDQVRLIIEKPSGKTETHTLTIRQAGDLVHSLRNAITDAR